MGAVIERTFVDLFAGAGGLSIGLEDAGWTALAAVEVNPDAVETYRTWHGRPERLRTGRPEPKIEEAPVELSLDSLRRLRGKASLVAGGPPCQPWSLGGLRRGHEDPRDGLGAFREVLRVVSPPAFLMENVAGLARGAVRPAFEDYLAELELLGEWDVHYRVLQAADYGVPQKRERVFVVGLPRGTPWRWPRAMYGEGRSRPWRAAGEVVGRYPFGTPNHSIVTYAKRPSLRPNPYHGQIFNGGGRPIDLDAPAPTLLASMGGNKTPWVDADGIVPEYHAHLAAGGAVRSGRQVPGARRITVEEAAALQTFPTGLRFSGSRSSQYRQVGNAVPPRLARAVGASLLRALTQTR